MAAVKAEMYRRKLFHGARFIAGTLSSATLGFMHWQRMTASIGRGIIAEPFNESHTAVALNSW